MFVEIEEDPDLGGWHVWLSWKDPRTTPSSDGWDIWAEDLQLVDEWIGPDELDVEWLDPSEHSEETPEDSSLRPRGLLPPLSRVMSITTLDNELHHARLFPSTIATTSDGVTVSGEVERLFKIRPMLRIGRFPVELTFSHASEAYVESGAEIEELIVEDIIYDEPEHVVQITGHRSGKLFIRTMHPSAQLDMGDRPSAIKHWWGWRPARR